MTTTRKIATIALILIVIGVLCAGAITQHKAENSGSADAAIVASENTFDRALSYDGYEVQEEIAYSIEDTFFMLMAEKFSTDNIKIYEPDELDYNTIINRKNSDTILIERLVGIANNHGSGRILNTNDTEYNYISYRGSNLDITENTVLVTYCVYNPDTNYDDDIIERYDYILTREYERKN